MTNTRLDLQTPGFVAHFKPTQLKMAARFLLTGTAATLLNLLLLWLLTARLGLWYLTASVLAFSVALICNFTFQKFWAFGAADMWGAHAQLLQFIAVNLFNLALNTAFLYILVDRLTVPYLTAQIVSSLLISANSFCAYRWIFQSVQTSFRS